MDADTLYEVPLMLRDQGLDDIVLKHLKLITAEPNMKEWEALVHRVKQLETVTEIAIVGKYVALYDAYLSIVESLAHAGFTSDTEIKIRWIEAEELTDDNAAELLAGVKGVLVPGGFGNRGIDGKISAIRYAREQNVPFFGICLGMQMAVVEYAKSVGGLTEASSTEVNPQTPHPVIDLLPEHRTESGLEDAMRLGLYPCKIEPDSLAMKCYGTDLIQERHRHRYELNNEYRDQLEALGLVVSGTSPDGQLVEIIELPDHPWFVAVQFHPEFTSRPNRPHPLFEDFVKAAARHA